MSIKRTIIATVAALALVVAIAPVPANATTVEDLLSQISTLQSQLTSLEGTSATTSTTSSSTYSDCVGVTFSRYLTVGSTGSDVKCMQQILNNTGYTIATTGAGSPGNETTYFGTLTLAAVNKWQAAQGWTTANQLGPKSIALMNSLIASSSSSSSSSSGSSSTEVTGDGLEVSLSSDTADAGEVLAGQSQAELATFTFSNHDSDDVKVTNIKFTRAGVSNDEDIDNVYLYMNGNRITDAASVSSSVITFNDSTGLFTVDSGDEVDITVVADIDADANGSVYIKLVSEEKITTDASTITGDFPISGKKQSIESVDEGDLATVEFQNSTSKTGTVAPDGTDTDPDSGVAVWEADVKVSNTDVDFEKLSLKQVGSIDAEDMENFTLYVEGDQVGETVDTLDDNGYVTFDLSDSPVTLETGTRTIQVKADIVGGSGKDFSFQLKAATDVTFVDTEYGVKVTPTTESATSFKSMRSCYNSTEGWGCTVTEGTVTLSKASGSPSGDIVDAASDQILGVWKFKAAGEKVKVEELAAYMVYKTGSSHTSTASGDLADSTAYNKDLVSGDTDDTTTKVGLDNAAFYLCDSADEDADCSQIGSTFTLLTDTTPDTISMGSSLIVDANEIVYIQLRADIDDPEGSVDDTVTGDKFAVYLAAGTDNAYGMTSDESLDVPSADKVAGTLTISTGTIGLAKYTSYTDQTVSGSKDAYKLGHFTLSGADNESTKVQTVTVTLNNSLADHVSNLYFTLGSYTSSTKSNPSDTSSWSISYTLAEDTTVDLKVYGDIDEDFVTTGVNSTGYVNVKVEGKTSESSTAVDENEDGQTISSSTGAAAVTLSSATPSSTVVAGGQLITLAKYKFTASGDDYTITQLKFTDDGNSAIDYLTVSDGTTTKTAAWNGTYFSFTSLGMDVEADSTVTITVSAMINDTLKTNGSTITTGKNVAPTLYYIKYENSSGTSSESNPSLAGKDIYAYRTVPTIDVGSITTSTEQSNLKNGSVTTLYKFTVAADSMKAVALKQLKFQLSTSDANTAATASLSTFKFYRGSDDITDEVTIMNSSSTSLEGSTTIASGTVVVLFDDEEAIEAGSTNTYSLKATPTGYTWSSTYGGDSVSTYLLADTSAASQATAKYYITGTSSTVNKLGTVQAGSGTNTDYNIIWSDNSAYGTIGSVTGHAYTSDASSADWFNGYKILTSNLDSISITCSD